MLRNMKHWVGTIFFDFSYGVLYRMKSSAGGNEDFSARVPGSTCSHAKYSILKPTLRYWYADPIAVNIAGTEFVFMEVFDRKKKKGLIGVSTYNEKGKLNRPEIVLEEPFHLSFPVVFEWNRNTYMLPESSESGQLRLYKMCESPFHFELFRTFETKEELVDTVVRVTEDGLLLLSCAECMENKKKTALRLFLLSDAAGGELSELKDAVFELTGKEGAESPEEYSYFNRNGGPIIERDGHLYRVLQESTPGEYGRNLKFTKIELLSTRGLSEAVVKDVYLSDFFVKFPIGYRRQGTHTFSCTQMHDVADVSFNRFHLLNCFMK